MIGITLTADQIVNAPAGQVARVIGAYARKDEAA